MNIVIFGTGKYYERYKHLFRQEHIIAFLDNNQENVGKYIDDIPVFLPLQIKDLKYDKIILTAAKAYEMQKQLEELGIPMDKVIYCKDYVTSSQNGKIDIVNGNFIIEKEKKNILLITIDLNYNGGTLAAIYAYNALVNKGYNVLLAAPSGNDNFVGEMTNDGVNIAIIPELPYIREKVLEWIKQFDLVFVNIFLMAYCAITISEVKPVLWWIHEATDFYIPTLTEFSECFSREKLRKINIKAVSSIPKNNFNEYFQNTISDMMPYGLPDISERIGHSMGKNDKTVIAIIGHICELKAQITMVMAFCNMCEKMQNIELWIIGSGIDSAYGKRLQELIDESECCDNVKVFGELTRIELEACYGDIDIVVCPSKEDSLPIVMTEAMMCRKVCICSDHAGTADFIVDGENGFVCEADSVSSLADALNRALEVKSDWAKIGENARMIYDKHFSMDSFAERLHEAVVETEELYNKSSL